MEVRLFECFVAADLIIVYSLAEEMVSVELTG
jgi:hypothetical protein